VCSRYNRQLIDLEYESEWPLLAGNVDRLISFCCRRFSYNENTLYWLRMCILSVFKKLRQKSYLIQKMLVLSISEWSQIWQIHEPLVSTGTRDRALIRYPLGKPPIYQLSPTPSLLRLGASSCILPSRLPSPMFLASVQLSASTAALPTPFHQCGHHCSIPFVIRGVALNGSCGIATRKRSALSGGVDAPSPPTRRRQDERARGVGVEPAGGSLDAPALAIRLPNEGPAVRHTTGVGADATGAGARWSGGGTVGLH